MKTLEQLEEEMKEAQAEFLHINRIACDAEHLAESLREEADLKEEKYDEAQRAVNMFDEDQIELAESKQDLEDDLAVTNALQE